MSTGNLGAEQYRTLLDGVRDLAAVVHADDFHRAAVGVLRRVVDDDWVASELYGGDTFDYRGGLIDPEVPGDLLEVFVTRAKENPMSRALQRNGQQRGLITSRSALKEAQPFETLPIYHDFYAKLDISQQAAVFTVLPDRTLLAHSLSRSRPYSSQELAMIEAIRPHLANAFLAWQTVRAVRDETHWLAESLAEADTALVQLDAAGRPVRQTPAAEAFLRRYFPANDRPASRLPRPLAAWVGQQVNEAPDEFITPPPMVVRERRGDRQLHVRLVRRERRDGYTLILRERSPWPSAEVLEHLFGLTSQRAAVLHFVVRGLETRAIASQMGLSPGTVRKHLEFVYRSLGVNSRAEAVAKVMMMAG
ncbi:MAG: helix-turn-helix transcriptional regulator [Planctomycetota bacterium]